MFTYVEGVNVDGGQNKLCIYSADFISDSIELGIGCTDWILRICKIFASHKTIEFVNGTRCVLNSLAIFEFLLI